MRALILITATLCVASCGPSPEEIQKAEQDAFVVAAKEDVSSKLLDPASAQFRELVVVDGADQKVLCGQINGKNSFGGYAGFQRFISQRAKDAAFDTRISRDKFDTPEAEHCHKALFEDKTNDSSIGRYLEVTSCSGLDTVFHRAHKAVCAGAVVYSPAQRKP